MAQSSVFQEEEKLQLEKKRLLQEQEKLLSGMQILSLEIRQEASRIHHLCRDMVAWETEEDLAQVQQAAETAQNIYAALENTGAQLFARPLSSLSKPRPLWQSSLRQFEILPTRWKTIWTHTRPKQIKNRPH